MVKMKSGSIRKRKDGSWEGRFYISGKRFSVYGPNKVECICKINKAIEKKEVEVNEDKIRNDYTLNEWFEKWLTIYKIPNIKAQSVYGITSKYNKYIKNSLGKKKIHLITALDWQKLFNEINYLTSAKKLFAFMKSCYGKAVINKIVIENPMLGVEISHKYIAKEKFVPTKKQLDMLITYLSKKRKALALVSEFISLTGCRVSEACALSIEDINYEKKTIAINKSYNRFLKKITAPKTAHSYRVIPLFSRAEEIINEYIELYGNKDVIFHKIKSENLTNTLKYYARKFGLVGLTPHSLRHYFSTLCREASIDEKVVQKWMGHSSVLMTLDTYTHVQRDFLNDQTSKFSKFLVANS